MLGGVSFYFGFIMRKGIIKKTYKLMYYIKIWYGILGGKTMLKEYIMENYEHDEPIF